MSRNNNDLPMLPPWLSESEVTTTGYEAPVQNLPHEELIPEDNGPRRRFSRKSDDRAEPEKKKRKSRRKDKSEDASPPAESASSWGPPESAVPRDEPPARNGGGPGWQQPESPAPYVQDAPAAEYRPAPQQFAQPPDQPAPQPPFAAQPPHTPTAANPATGPVPTRPGERVPPAPQSTSRPPIPPAPPQPDGGSDEMTMRVTRRPDLPPSPPQSAPTPPRQPAPTPPPLPDWPQAAPSQRSAPPRLGVPPQFGADAAAAQPVSRPEAVDPRSVPGTDAPADNAGPGQSPTGPQADQAAHEPVSSATAPAKSAAPMGDAQEPPNWLTGNSGPMSAGAFSADIASAAAQDIADATAQRAPSTPAQTDNSAPEPVGANNSAPVWPDTSAPAQPPHSAPEHSIPARPPYAPAPESVSRPAHSGPMPAVADVESTTFAPRETARPPRPDRAPKSNSGAYQGDRYSSPTQASTPEAQWRGDTQASPSQAPVPDAPWRIGAQAPPSQAPGPEAPWQGGAQASPSSAPEPNAPWQAGAQAPAPDTQWQGGAQAPGPDAQRNAPRQPDQYSQPQQYAQPNPYAQGPQQGSAEQYQQQYQNPQAQQQYQQGQPPQGQYQQGPQHGQYQQGQQYPPNGPGPSLEDVPMRRAKKAPGSGWRRAVHHMSGGAINPGMSAEEIRLQELVARIRQPVRGDYRIATLSLKGGVGKTTTTMGIGSIFASIRGDRVIAVDANPDFGTLSQRVPLQTRSSVRDLLLDQSINSYGDVRRHTSQATSRLEVLASERDPAASESFSEDEYRQVLRVLQRFYNIILTDCGTGLMHSAMAGVLDLAHSLVLISSSAIDGARSAAATLDWLSLHGHDHLVRNAVVVINLPREGSPNVAIQHLREYFLARCRAVHVIPYDPHLAEGAEIDLARLGKNTKRALVELAATVADDFATDHRPFNAY
ncbi:AAA family ATPase [Nocardia nova]|uniref:nucleotide-binding protein n=1 Tax=Nocardia nova TaxID=37330 RepID=UPI0033EBD0A5